MKRFNQLIVCAAGESDPARIITYFEKALALQGKRPPMNERLKTIIRIAKSKPTLTATPEGKDYIRELEKKLAEETAGNE